MPDHLSGGYVAALIVALGIVTYLTRAGGYLVLSRFKRLHPRLEAALEAVPAAVITTIVVPPALSAGPAEMLAILAAGVAALRLSGIVVVILGLAVLVAARLAGL